MFLIQSLTEGIRLSKIYDRIPAVRCLYSTREKEVSYMKKQYGYIRVSARDQNPERQYVALEELGIQRENIYMDKLSGKDFSRSAYRKRGLR